MPWGIAGIYRRWRDQRVNGSALFTFGMLTVNCDTHPFYKRFHKPGDEKRMPIFLERGEYMPWLTCSIGDASLFFKQHPGPFLGEPAPLARAPKLVGDPPSGDELLPPTPAAPPMSTKAPRPKPPEQGNLF